MLVTIEKVLLLKQIPQFKTVSNLALSDLMAVSVELTVKKGEELIRAGEPNKYMYFLLSGSLTEEGDKVKTTIEAKAVVGLNSVFLITAAKKRVVTKEKCTLLRVEREQLYRMMALHPSLATTILNELSSMIHS